MAFHFDHIAIGCADLDTGTAWVEEKLGVTLVPGGKHTKFGTHNRLLGMGDLYLEVIAKDPDAAPIPHATWFDLDNFTGPPRLTNWICRSDDIEKHQDITGPALALTRDDLTWDLTVPDDGRLPMDGGFPTLLRWGDGIIPPSRSLPDSGCRLVEWHITHPNADWLREHVNVQGAKVTFHTGPIGFEASFETPHGRRFL